MIRAAVIPLDAQGGIDGEDLRQLAALAEEAAAAIDREQHQTEGRPARADLDTAVRDLRAAHAAISRAAGQIDRHLEGSNA